MTDMIYCACGRDHGWCRCDVCCYHHRHGLSCYCPSHCHCHCAIQSPRRCAPPHLGVVWLNHISLTYESALRAPLTPRMIFRVCASKKWFPSHEFIPLGANHRAERVCTRACLVRLAFCLLPDSLIYLGYGFRDSLFPVPSGFSGLCGAV